MKKENLSYYIIISATVLIFLGVLLGSFIQGTIYLGALGGFLLLVGIILYIVSELRKKSD